MSRQSDMGPKRVFVVGVGLTKFERPSGNKKDYPDLVKEAVMAALRDAKIAFDQVEQACVGYVYGDSTCGQRALYDVGMNGIPIYNVNNNCATGSTALLLAKRLVEGGSSNCAMAVGFEKMDRGSLTSKFRDRANPLEKHMQVLARLKGISPAPVTAQLFGSAGMEHMEKFGTRPEHFAKIAWKNHMHATKNPNAQLQDKYSMEQVLSSPAVFGPLTRLQCCPPSTGAAAAVLVNEEFVRRHGLEDRAVEILGIEMATDLPSTLEEDSCIKVVGFDMTKKAADTLYKKTGISPRDVDVIELHDCFSTNELITYEALGLCDVGKGGELVDSGNNTYGGKYVINPSGGLISKGHPLGATGIAQCAELCWQLRKQAGARQVPEAKLALQHNIGLGGAVVVALYRHGFPNFATKDQPKYLFAKGPGIDTSQFKSFALFSQMAPFLDMVSFDKTISGSICIRIKGPEGNEGAWTLSVNNGKGSLTEGEETDASCSICMSDDDAMKLFTRKLSPASAFAQGKLKVSGDIRLPMKLVSSTGLLSKL